MSIIVYPRLYTSGNSESNEVVMSSGDVPVGLLYQLLMDQGVNHQSWDHFYAPVLKSALRLFGDFGQWLVLQNQNPNLVGYSREFLKDTLDFIRTGKRSIGVHLWMDLIADGGDLHHPRAVPFKLLSTPIQANASEATVQVLHSWISRHNGLEDLLVSLHLLFGAARKS